MITCRLWMACLVACCAAAWSSAAPFEHGGALHTIQREQQQRRTLAQKTVHALAVGLEPAQPGEAAEGIGAAAVRGVKQSEEDEVAEARRRHAQKLALRAHLAAQHMQKRNAAFIGYQEHAGAPAWAFDQDGLEAASGHVPGCMLVEGASAPPPSIPACRCAALNVSQSAEHHNARQHACVNRKDVCCIAGLLASHHPLLHTTCHALTVHLQPTVTNPQCPAHQQPIRALVPDHPHLDTSTALASHDTCMCGGTLNRPPLCFAYRAHAQHRSCHQTGHHQDQAKV